MNRQVGNYVSQILQQFAQKIFRNALTKKLAGLLAVAINFVALSFRLRSRYFLTRSNYLRLRYVVVCFVFMATGISALTLVSQNSNALSRTYVPIAYVEPATYPGDGVGHLFGGDPHAALSLASVTAHDIPEPLPLDREITVQSGDVLSLVMEKQGVGNTEAQQIIKAMKEHYDPRNIKAGQKIHMHFDEGRDRNQYFREMKIDLNPIKTLVVARAGQDFRAQIDEKEVDKVVKAKQAKVKVSLYGSAAKAGIPQGVVAEAIHIFSWNVDFQRDIRPDDTLEIMYESYETKSGYVAKNGNILYAKLTLSGREIPLYRYEMADGRIDYFQPDGRSIKRTLMKTPIDGARMSSGYGMRRHPVLGYNKMHKGVDFAAPTGTPIYAAGDGVVEHAGWYSSYGKYVRIRHNSKLKTAYAHMSKIKPTVKTGTRVTQGQVIGYVGTTGRSTGAHLHYEVLSGGRQVNPRSVDLPVGEELEGKDKEKFKTVVAKSRQLFASALEGTRVAERANEKRSLFN